MEIKDIKQLALDLSSHSCPSSNLFFSKNRASTKKLLVELHSPWCVGMWSCGHVGSKGSKLESVITQGLFFPQ